MKTLLLAGAIVLLALTARAQDVVLSLVTPSAPVSPAATVQLDLLAVNHPAREHVRTITDWVRNDPAMHTVLLYRALRGMLLADPHAPVVTELTRLLSGRTDAERLGVHPETSPGQLAHYAGERLVHVQRQAISTRTAAEDAALAELVRTYTSMRRQA